LAETAWLSLADGVLLADGVAVGFAAGWAGAWGRAPKSAELTDWVPAVAEAGGISLAGSLSCWAAVMKSWAVTVVPP
jgi:hypothetical protein